MLNKNIDGGNAFDFGLVSENYAKYRDIYPESFFNKIYELGFYHKSQKVLDMGTGSGVLPRKMYKYGAEITAADISENQIKYAAFISNKENMNINYIVGSDVDLEFDKNAFDTITACQCYFYFNHQTFAEKSSRWLKDGGKLGIFYMGWLSDEDKTANMSEQLIRKYNPKWNGYGDYRHKISLPDIYNKYYEIHANELFDAEIPFTRESWNGRIKACRGIGASLSAQEVEAFETEHMHILKKTTPEMFYIKHYCAILSLKKK